MAATLRVDGTELDRFMRLLTRSNDSLKGLRKVLGSATATGLGSGELDRACEEFQADLKYGAEQLGKQTEDLAKIIAASKDSYREVDKALEEAMKKAAAKGGRGGRRGSGGTA
ncbi:hypothetical protein [Streptomyces sp. NPDC002564]|uniref:hypothetical protein n=1 Tax=Streptomyces sp. NPDC002564 TaxID=3364649 RepID=UPI0036C2D11C